MQAFKAYRLTETPDRKIKAGFVDTTLDELDPGDVVVRVAYSSVNYKDALAATGKGRILRRPSCIGGIDFSGTVISSTDPRYSKGDAVLTVSGEYVGVSHDGGYAPYARVKGDWICKVPQGLSLWEAMAFGTAGYTAGIAVHRMEHNGLTPAKGPVVVSGATGGVGSVAIAALARLGYHVVALTGKEGETEWLKRLGAREILLRSSLNL
jgi:acrylyl-CoA reductase (NADPH)